MLPTLFMLTRPLSVLIRPDDSLQVGLDAEGALLIPCPPPGAEVAVRALRRPRTLLEVTRLVPAVPDAWLRELVTLLVDAGLARPVEPPVEPPVPTTVTVVGAGALHDGLTRLLEAEGWSVRDGEGPSAGLVVLCSPTAEPDRVLTRDLTSSGVPHLVVRAEPERAVVGPFVTPGASACVGCGDLVRRDLDPGFPHLLAQLCRSVHVPAPRQVAWVTAMASAQLSAWRAGHRPESVGATLELDAYSGSVGVRRWPQHPDCGCLLAVG